MADGGGEQLKHRLMRSPIVEDRQEWILDQVRGRSVLHMGCADVGFLEHNVDRKRFLHEPLEQVCSAVLGIDIDGEAIQRMKELGFETVAQFDIGEDPLGLCAEIRARMGACDVILCGEVLEHLLDYEGFLRGVRTVARELDAVLLVTVPNAFNVEGFLHLITGNEFVHPDHKCYFSETTLRTLLTQTGFDVVEVCYYTNRTAKSKFRKTIKRVIRHTLLAARPQFAEGIIAFAKPEVPKRRA